MFLGQTPSLLDLLRRRFGILGSDEPLYDGSPLSLATSSRVPVIPQRARSQPFQSIPARFSSQAKV